MHTIGTGAFRENEIETLGLPQAETYTKIARDTFSHNNLTEVDLPNNIKSIEKDAFRFNGRNKNQIVALFTPNRENPNNIENSISYNGGHIIDPNIINIRYIYKDTDGEIVELRPQ